MREIISERWEIRSADLKIDKSSLALDGHGDEGSDGNVFKLDQDAAYLTGANVPLLYTSRVQARLLPY